MLKPNRSIALICSLSFSLVLGACGGGDPIGSFTTPNPDNSVTIAPTPDPVVPTPTTAYGVWIGQTDAGRAVNALILEDGSYWVLYSTLDKPNIIAGAVHGTSASKDGTFTSDNARDFSIERGQVNDGSVNAVYSPRVNFDGAITYQGGTKQTFTSVYNPIYDNATSLLDLAGNYTGTAAVIGGQESTTLRISAAGNISGFSASGCAFSGTAASLTEGAIFSLTIKFAGGNCSNGTDTITGVGVFDAALGSLTGIGLNGDRSNGMIFTGAKG